MFIGTSEQKTDDKNRLIIPIKWREALGSTCYLCAAPEGCLFIYTEEEWNRVASQIVQNSRNIEDRAKQRQFLYGATDANVDKQGRVTLTPILMKRAGIKKEIVVNGGCNRIEIWAQDRWDNAPGSPDVGEGSILDEDQFPDMNW